MLHGAPKQKEKKVCILERIYFLSVCAWNTQRWHHATGQNVSGSQCAVQCFIKQGIRKAVSKTRSFSLAGTVTSKLVKSPLLAFHATLGVGLQAFS